MLKSVHVGPGHMVSHMPQRSESYPLGGGGWEVVVMVVCVWGGWWGGDESALPECSLGDKNCILITESSEKDAPPSPPPQPAVPRVTGSKTLL